MINRASVQLWGKAGQSAGPPKSAGKKSDCDPDRDPDRDPDTDRDRRSGGTDPGDLNENSCFFNNFFYGVEG